MPILHKRGNIRSGNGVMRVTNEIGPGSATNTVILGLTTVKEWL